MEYRADFLNGDAQRKTHSYHLNTIQKDLHNVKSNRKIPQEDTEVHYMHLKPQDYIKKKSKKNYKFNISLQYYI